MATRSCPPEDVLLALATGEPGDEAAREHIRHCQRCAADVARMRGEVQAFRAAACGPGPGPSAPSTGATAGHAPSPALNGSTTGLATDPPPAPAIAAAHADEMPPPYEYLELLGEGGMGVVYLVRDPAMDRQLALKVLRQKYRRDARMVRKFLEEARITAQLQHPGIPPVHSQGTLADGRPYLTMKRIRGETLADLLARRKGPAHDLPRFLAIFEQLCQALAYAHDRGVVHRDLKPANVMVGAFGEVQVMDWGLCKHIGRDQADDEGAIRPLPEGIDRDESRGAMGTLAYMPPEQARGELKQVGTRSDVFGLGAILCVILTGEPPYRGRTRGVLFAQAENADLADAYGRLEVCGADADLIALARCCLSPGPADRPEDAAAIARAVAAHLAAVQERLRTAELAEVEARERAGREEQERLLTEQLVAEARAKAAQERRARRMTLGLAAALLVLLVAVAAATGWRQSRLGRADRLLDQAEVAANRAESDPKADPSEARVALGSAAEALSGLLDSDRRKRLVAVETRLDQSERARGLLDRFRRRRDEALYHATQFAGLDPTSSRDATRRSAETALATFATTSAEGSWTIGSLPRALTPDERSEVSEGAYVLMLVLAGDADDPSGGLRHLEWASKLRPPTTAYQRRLAGLLAKVGDRDGAEEARRAAESLTSESPFDHFLSGMERFDRHECSAALDDFDAALRDQPDHFWAHALSAVCCLQPEENRPGEARVHLTACLQAEPSAAWPYVLRGFASYQAHALASAASRGKTSPTSTSLLEAAEADYLKAGELLAKRPNEELQYVLMVNRALLRLARADMDGATGELKAAIALNDRPYLAHANLAQVYQSRDEVEEALTEFDRAIERGPPMAALHRGRADVVLGMKSPSPEQRAGAMRDLEAAIRLEADDRLRARDLARQGLALSQEGKGPETLAACEAALGLWPDLDEAQVLRVRSLLRLGRFDKARQGCDALVAGGKGTAEVFDLRRLARERLGDYPGAIEDLTELLARQPDRADVLAHRGDLYLIQNAPQMALRDFEAALRLDPGRADAYAGRALCRARAGQDREALADAAKAVGLGRDEPRVLYKAARVQALAAEVARVEVRTRGQEAVDLMKRHQEAAIQLVREAYVLTPEDERETFEQVLRTDPVLVGVRDRVRLPRSTRPASPGSFGDAAPREDRDVKGGGTSQ
jgi:serine/threonine protein kinase/Tfp pilus assembly protein PilF